MFCMLDKHAADISNRPAQVLHFKTQLCQFCQLCVICTEHCTALVHSELHKAALTSAQIRFHTCFLIVLVSNPLHADILQTCQFWLCNHAAPTFCSSASIVKLFGLSIGSPKARDHTPFKAKPTLVRLLHWQACLATAPCCFTKYRHLHCKPLREAGTCIL